MRVYYPFVASSIILVYFHLYIYSCTKCSKLFVWWTDLFGRTFNLSFIPLLFSAILLLYLVIISLSKANLGIAKVLRICLSVLSILNIVYWLYIIALLNFTFIASYVIAILIHVIFVLFLRRM